MTAQFSYIVYPEAVDRNAKFSGDYPNNSDFSQGVIGISVLLIVIGIFAASSGGDPGLLMLGIIGLVGFFGIKKIITSIMDANDTKEMIVNQINRANTESEFYTDKLNSILTKSDEIVNKILPYFELSAKQSIDKAKFEFSENAFTPFWDKIEDAAKYLGCFREAVQQLSTNSELYRKILENKKHTFPAKFPIRTNISISQDILNDFEAIVRKGQTNFQFTNIYMHVKTHNILIAGFTTLENAIHTMRDAICSSLDELNYSITSNLNELKHIQREQIQTYESSQLILNNTLSQMDTKLYYIQYNKKPLRPFIRPLNDF